MILTLAKRELHSLFLSPLAWIILAVTQFILAWVFFASIDVFFNLQSELKAVPNAPGITDLVIAPLFETASILLLMVTPLLTMRQLSEEQRNKTLTLLISSPLSITDIILGKYLGMLAFMFIFILMISLMPFSLQLGSTLDTGKVVSGLLGLFLILAALSAAGLYFSSLTDNPVIAAISTFGLLLLLWIISSNDVKTLDQTNVLDYLSLTHHFSNLLRGLFNTADLVYFALFIISFLVLAIRQLENRRL